jgi:glycosyltransferase involved in cell wall biosynthesis
MVSLDLADPRGSLGQAMVRLATDPGLARHLAALGRHRAASFSWERCAADHSAVYRHAVAA